MVPAETLAIPVAPAPASAPATASAPLRRRAFGFVLAATGIGALLAAASAPSPFYPVFEARFGITSVGIAIVFAVYAVVLLLSLLTVGALSDHLGRRPVISLGFGVLTVGMLVFWNADSMTTLILARAVQGIASGLLLSALSATVTDFAHRDHPRRAALSNSAMPMLGLTIGAVSAGGALTAFPQAALAVVFGILAAVYAALAILIWFVPETAARVPGAARSLVPRVSVPPAARRLFLLSVPVVVGGWATGGLFFSLGPDIALHQLRVGGAFVESLVIAALPAAGALAVLLLKGWTPRTVTILGSAALTLGTATSLLSLMAGSFPSYLVGVTVTGTGFGTAFMGVIGSLAPLVSTHQRAGLFAALYTVSYLSFGLPTVIAGALVPMLTLSTTAVLYGVFVVLAAGSATFLRLVERDHDPDRLGAGH